MKEKENPTIKPHQMPAPSDGIGSRSANHKKSCIQQSKMAKAQMRTMICDKMETTPETICPTHRLQQKYV